MFFSHEEDLESESPKSLLTQNPIYCSSEILTVTACFLTRSDEHALQCLMCEKASLRRLVNDQDIRHSAITSMLRGQLESE